MLLFALICADAETSLTPMIGAELTYFFVANVFFIKYA